MKCWMRRLTGTVIIVTWIAIASAGNINAGGALSILMSKAGMSDEEVEHVLSLPTNYNISDDIEMILPGKFMVYSKDGLKGVEYYVKDTVPGRVIYHLKYEDKK